MEKQKSNPPVRVRATRAICGTDGDMAVVVLKGTLGTVASGGVHGFPRKGDRPDAYSVAVVWDAVILNKDPNNPGIVSEGWEWDDVPANALEYVGVEARKPDPPKGQAAIESTKKTVIKVGYKEFERLVGKVYGQDWSFVADQECGNDQTISLDADGTVYDEGAVRTFSETGRGSWLAGLLLNDLVRRGELEPGDYLIDVSW